MDERHLGNKEAAEYLGLDTRVLKVFRSRNPGLFPEPAEELACGPIWHESQLEPIKNLFKEGGESTLRKAALTIKPEYQKEKKHAAKRKAVIEKATKQNRPIALDK